MSKNTVIIANTGDHDQTAPKEQSDLGLHGLLKQSRVIIKECKLGVFDVTVCKNLIGKCHW